jgi:hypothetical protein
MKRKKPIFGKNRKAGGSGPAGLVKTLFSGLLPRLFKGPMLFLLLLLAAVVILGWLSEQARRFPRFRVYGEAVRCLGRPAWLAASERLTSEVVSDIQDEILRRWSALTVFDDDLDRALRERPAAFSPWIESIEAFERIYPSRFRIEVKLRKPVATFEESSRSYFIDANGVVVAPVAYLDQGLVKVSVPRITEFDKAGELIAGRPVWNRRLIEGAAVAAEIAVFDEVGIPPSQLEIDEINVANYQEGRTAARYDPGHDPARDVILFGNGGVPILWGRSARHKQFEGIDPSPRQKALNLKKVLERFPGLAGLKEVNLTQEKAYVIPEDA